MHANCATVARQQPAKTRKFLAGLTRTGTTLWDQPKKVLLTTILSMTSKERRRMVTSQKRRSIQMTTSKPFPDNSKISPTIRQTMSAMPERGQNFVAEFGY